MSKIDFNEIDLKLQELALADFEQFCKLAGIDKKQAYVCFEIAKGKSLKQISLKINLSKGAVYLRAKKCSEKQNAI